jgi:hypothetical protein
MSDVSAFRVDDQYDVEPASDRQSRYGAYLSQKRNLFHYDGLDQPPTRCPVRFAINAWIVATPPIMAPGYVVPHARIQNADFHWDDSRAALAVDIAVPAPPIADHLRSRWSGWIRDEYSARWQDPYSNDKVTVLSILTIRIPLSHNLFPTPHYSHGLPDTRTAKESVATLCRIASAELDDLLFVIDTPADSYDLGLRP